MWFIKNDKRKNKELLIFKAVAKMKTLFDGTRQFSHSIYSNFTCYIQ